MSNKENLETSLSAEENLKRRRETIVKVKSKSLNPPEKSNEEESNGEIESDLNRGNSDKKGRHKSQKVKMKIKRQASLEDHFPIGKEDPDKGEREVEESRAATTTTATATTEGVATKEGKKFQFLEELKIPKIEIMRKNGMGESLKGLKEYAILSPNSSKLRERFSRSKLLKQESKNLNVELSKSSDSGIGVSRSTEDESLKNSESVIFRFFDVGPETRLNKSDSEKSPNFLDTVSLFTRSRSHERSVSSDSSDKNLSDLDKPSIKIRKRHEYSESRDSSSSYEGNIFDAHISNRVRKLHEVALKQMSEESARNQKMDSAKRSVEFKQSVEFGSYDSIPVNKTPSLSKVRKFKSLERTDSNAGGESFEEEIGNRNPEAETPGKTKNRIKKQDRFDKRLSLKDKRTSLSRDSGLSADRKKEKRCRGFLKPRKDVGEDESDENVDAVDGGTDSREKDPKGKEELSKRLSRKDKKSCKKTKRALSEEQRGSRKERSLLFSITGGKRRSDSETRNGRRDLPEEEDEGVEEREIFDKGDDSVRNNSESDKMESREISKSGNPACDISKKLFPLKKSRSDSIGTRMESERNRNSLDFADLGSCLEMVGKMWPMSSDDYKIVFISSDSSTKENRSISTDSDSGSAESGSDSSKKLISDCDWDYFDSSSMCRPVIGDRNSRESPKNFGGSFPERGSPVFSTSDDNSPKFPRRSLDEDSSGFSPDPKRKKTNVDESKSDPEKSADTNDNSNVEEEKEIEITDLKEAPPIKSKELNVVKEGGIQKKEAIADSFSPGYLKMSEEIKKSKKRKKSKKSKKGTLKDEEDLAEEEDKQREESTGIEEDEKSTTDRDGKKSEEEMVVGSVAARKSSGSNEGREESTVNDSMTVDPTPVVVSVEKTVLNSPVVRFKSEGGLANKDFWPRNKAKMKRGKSKKKCDKCGMFQRRSENWCNAVTKEFVEEERSSNRGAGPGGGPGADGDVVANEFAFRSGSFGFQTQNVIPSQRPGVFAYDSPISNVLRNANAYQNFVPIPVPVLIPVPFPVPSAIWSKHNQNFFFPNFNFDWESFDLWKSLQTPYGANYQSFGGQTRSDGQKERCLESDENNSTGTGSDSSIHRTRPNINVRLPALAMTSLPGSSQGSVNSVESDLTCLTDREQPFSTDDKQESVRAITKDSVGKGDAIRQVATCRNVEKEEEEKAKNKKWNNSRVDKSIDRSKSIEIEENRTEMSETTSKSDSNLADVFLEGKTFREVKNDLRHKCDLALSDSFLSRLFRGEVTEEIRTGNLEGGEIIESIGRRIEGDSSESSQSEDSDCDRPRKPFKRCYYFNLGDSEGKTSDDSDIADLGSLGSEESKTENSSHDDSTASEDEGNPEDSRFSEVYVVNPIECDGVDGEESKRENGWEEEKEEDDSRARKSNRKLKNLLPLKNFPLSEETDSDDAGNESSIVLLKHVKKLSEDYVEEPKESKSVQKLPKSPIDDSSANKQTKSSRGDLHNWRDSGVEAEDPVILVSHLAARESERARVASTIDNREPETVPESLIDGQKSEAVPCTERDSVSSNSVVEKVEGRPTANRGQDIGGNESETGKLESEKDSVDRNGQFSRNLRDDDVINDADGDEVIECDSKDDLIPDRCVASEEIEGKEENSIGGGQSRHPEDSIESKECKSENRNGLSLLDKIESRIRHFSQLDDFSVCSPREGKEAKYTSLIVITQDKNEKSKSANDSETDESVKVIATNTTKVLGKDNPVCLRHANRVEDEVIRRSRNLEDYYTMTLENSRGLVAVSPKRPNVIKNMSPLREEDEIEGGRSGKEEVRVVTDDKTLSAVICLEEGLADDDSWVEDLEKDRENDFFNGGTDEESCSSGDETQIGACVPVQHSDREEELRGYHRGAINFTLHTIVEESCEESEVEERNKSVPPKKRPASVTDLEKYFYFDIGGGGGGGGGGATPNFENQDLDTFSESSSSIYSDGGAMDDANGEAQKSSDQIQLSTSRLEKYFLNFDRDGREKESDGSVGSDSEGPPSPEQKRKRLFRARGSNRLHSNSLDNLVQSENEQQSVDVAFDSEDSSTETDLPDAQNIDKSDDSVKRKKKRKISGGSSNVPLVVQEGTDKKVVVDGDVTKENRESLTREHRHGRETREEAKESKDEIEESKGGGGGDFDGESDDERSKTPQADFASESTGMNRDKQQSRDSGFIGSCDDLLKDQKTGGDSSGSDTKKKKNGESAERISKDVREMENSTEATANRQQLSSAMMGSNPPASNLNRKDSFNNWSSDEETNLMMSKMRQFFKAMVSVPNNSNKMAEMSNFSIPQVKTAKGVKSPQLVYFENELTRLMKTVPGIRDDQVREIVEYLSSEDTWSDSYDSSDYTSSDLEGAAAYHQRTRLQQEISESCKQIIDKFDQSKSDQEQKPKVPPRRNSSPMNRDTALVYQKLVASFNKITNESENSTLTPHSSPPLFAKVMHHIGSRLVALMHEVSSNSSGEGSISSHKCRYHKRLSQKLSNVSSTTEEECCLTDESDCKGDEATSATSATTTATTTTSTTTTTGNGQNLPYFQLLHQLPRSKSHDLLLEEAKVKSLRSSSSGVSDIAEEKEASDYERFSWRGSFESALMADSRSKLTLLSSESHSSNTNLAAKRRSAGDLLFLKSLSREQLDRVRSCGSIGGVSMEDKNIWATGRAERNGRRRSSVPDAASPGSGASADGDEDSSDSEMMQERSITLPRSLQSIVSSQNTNSLPRLPTTGAGNNQNLSKAQSVQHFLPNAKSVRYRPPGFNRMVMNSPKRAVSAPGLQLLQPSHARRERKRNQNVSTGNPSSSLSGDELNNLDSSGTIVQVHGGSKSASPSPIVGNAKSRLRRGPSSIGSPDWSGTEELQRFVSVDHQRQSNSSLGARSDSLASVYSGAGEGRSCSIPVRGEVEFGLQYNYKAGDLEIHVKQCKDLAAVDAKRNRSDPYVKVYLLPDKSKSGKRKTKVKKHTLNPIFDEVLKFHISLSGLETRTLWLTVWHSDMFGRNDFLGEVMMSLENKVFDDPTPRSYALQERTEPFEDILSYKGEIIIGLKFVPPDAVGLQKKGKRSKGALNVKVKEAKNLTAVKSNGVSDPFCKSYLLPDKGKNSKQKTPVQRRTCNPSWNETFVYEDVSLQELSERCLELTVWDRDRLASNEFLGGLRFSLGTGKHHGKPVDWMDSTGKEVALWQSMLEKPNLWVEGCLPLRASLDPPNGVS